MPPPLAPIQWLDFRRDYNAAVRSLLSALPRTVREVRPVKAKPARAKGYVFLSYAEEDTQFIEGVRRFVEGRGYDCKSYEERESD